MDYAKNDWNSLFTPSTGEVWNKERKELKKAAMLLHVLSLELSKVQCEAETQLQKYRAMFVEVDDLKCDIITRKAISPRDVGSNDAKPLNNISIKKLNETNSQLTNKASTSKSSLRLDIPTSSSTSFKTATKIYSPDLFTNESSTSVGSFASTIILTDNDESKSPTLVESPKLNRNSKYIKMKKHKVLESKKLFSPQPEVKRTSVENAYIEATPQKKLKTQKFSNKSLVGKKKQLTQHTLTQFLPTLNKKEKTTMIIEENENDNDETINALNESLKEYIQNYDKIPGRDDTVDKTQIEEEKLNDTVNDWQNCKKCIELETKCSAHRVPPVLYSHRTFTGFWDIGFPDENHSEKSTIFW